MKRFALFIFCFLSLLAAVAADLVIDLKQYPLQEGKTSFADGVLKLTGDAKNKELSTTIEVPVKPYSYYLLTAEMRGKNIKRTASLWVYGAGINLQANKSVIFRGSKTGRWKHRIGSFEWEKFEVRFKTWDEKAVTLACELSAASGVAEFRNFKLTEITPKRNEITVSGTVFADTNGNGKFDSGEKGFAGVKVSDGKTIAVTDANGKYTIARAAGRYIFAAKPEDGVFTTPRYLPLQNNANFGVKPIAPSASVRFYTLNDSEDKDALKFIGKVAAEQKKLPGLFLVHCGDIGNQSGHAKTMTRAGLPVYYAIGNHDFKWSKSGAGEESFEKHFGPVYHSFDHAGIHFIFLAYYAGVDVIPARDFEQRQYQWLLQDLKLNSLPIIVFRHHPLRFGDRASELLKRDGRMIAMVSGHTHATQARKHGNVLSVECAPPEKGAVDHSPAGFMRMTIENGKLNIEILNGLTARPAPEVSADAPAVKTAGNWMQFRKDTERSGRSQTPLKMPLKLRWKTKLSGPVFASSPLIVDGRVFIAVLDDAAAETGAVFALDAASGKILWKTLTGASVKHTLASDGKRVYGACVDGTGFAMDCASGKILWKNQVRNYTASDGLYAPATLFNNRLFIGGDHWTELNPATGKFVRKDTKFNRGSPCHAGLVIAGESIFSAENWRMGLFCHHLANGRLKWNARRTRGDYSYIDAGPAWYNGKLYQKLVGRARIVDPANGKTLVEAKLPTVGAVKESLALPLVLDNRAFFASAHGMFAFDADTLKLLWQFIPGKETGLSVPYAKEHLPVIHSSPAAAPGALIFGGADGFLYVLDPADGKKLLAIDCGAPVYSSPALSGNTVIIANTDGMVMAFTSAE